MDWIKDDIAYVPNDKTRGIVYFMEYNGLKYIGKKTIKTKKGKDTNWKSYYGSSDSWLEHIKDNEDKVTRIVLYECANLVELGMLEDYELYTRLVLWDDTFANKNIAMKANTRNIKNFMNTELLKDKVKALRE